MKKIGVIIIALLILSLFLVTVSSQESNLPPDVEKISGIGDTLSDTSKNKSYFKAEWEKRLLDNPIGYSAVKIWIFSKPALTLAVGRQAEISWGFGIALAIWFCFLFGFKYILDNFSLFSKTTSLIISFCLVVILALTKLTGKISEALDGLMSKWWGKLIILIVLIIIIIVAIKLNKGLTKMKEAAQAESDKTVLHAAAESARKNMKPKKPF